jgi:HEAT repeat protein
VRLAVDVDWMLGARLAGSDRDIAPIVVVKILETIDEDDCDDIIEILGKINTPQVIAILFIPALVKLLLDPIDRVRRSAIEALMQLKAIETIPNLIIMLSDRHQNVRRNAAYALEKLEAKEAIPFLENMLGDPDYQVRNMVLRVLERMLSML